MVSSSCATPERRLIQRKPARELLENVDKIAGSRWMPYMQGIKQDLIKRYAHVELGIDYDVEFEPPGWWGSWWGRAGRWKVTPDPGTVYEALGVQLAENRRRYQFDGVFPESDDGKNLAYLLGVGRDSPPGIGNLGSLALAGKTLSGRPMFGRAAAAALNAHRGGDRRHITAWHNISALLSEVIAAGKIGMLEQALTTLRRGHPPVLVEADALVDDRVSERMRGELSERDARIVFKAAYVMFNQTRNIWVGGRAENQSLGPFSMWVKVWSRKLAARELSKADFFEKIGKYPSAPGSLIATAQGKLTANPKLDALWDALEGIEVDLPGPRDLDPPSGPVLAAEKDAHHRLFTHLYKGAALNDHDLEAVIRFLVAGETPSFAAAGQSSWPWTWLPLWLGGQPAA